MKNLLVIFLALSSSVVNAALVDFESTPVGTYNQLVFSDFTLNAENNASFDVTTASPGSPISGHCLITLFQQEGYVVTPLYVNFNISGVNSFQVGVGDYGADVDNTYLEAYDASNNLIANDYYQNPSSKYGGGYLSVNTGKDISYVKFWDAAPNAGAVYWDNISYNSSSVPSVPVPGAILLGSLGIGVLGWLRKSRIV